MQKHLLSMKNYKVSKILLATLVTLASLYAQYYINTHQAAATTPQVTAQQLSSDSTDQSPRLQLDIEIVKTVIQHSTHYLPIIGTPSTTSTLD